MATRQPQKTYPARVVGAAAESSRSRRRGQHHRWWRRRRRRRRRQRSSSRDRQHAARHRDVRLVHVRGMHGVHRRRRRVPRPAGGLQRRQRGRRHGRVHARRIRCRSCRWRHVHDRDRRLLGDDKPRAPFGLRRVFWRRRRCTLAVGPRVSAASGGARRCQRATRALAPTHACTGHSAPFAPVRLLRAGPTRIFGTPLVPARRLASASRWPVQSRMPSQPSGCSCLHASGVLTSQEPRRRASRRSGAQTTTAACRTFCAAGTTRRMAPRRRIAAGPPRASTCSRL
jgi:hypothetical protein